MSSRSYAVYCEICGFFLLGLLKFLELNYKIHLTKLSVLNWAQPHFPRPLLVDVSLTFLKLYCTLLLTSVAGVTYLD